MRLRVASFLLLACAVIAAQTKTAKHAGATALSAYKLIAVNVKGTHYKPADVIAASGLHLGEDVTEQSFKAATSKLGDTGLFTDITYSYSYSPAGTKLDLELADNSELVPLRFENFVWFSDQELIDKLHAQLGLFESKVPVSGSLVDQVANVLSGLLASHDPKLHATYLRAAPSPDSPKIDSVVFSASGVPIQVGKVVYAAASPTLAGPLAEVAKKIEGGDYSRAKMGFFASMDVRTVYQQHGYLKAAFSDPEPVVVSETQEKVLVDVKLPVSEGQQYKLSSIDWAGDTPFPASTLQTLIHLVPNQPANAVQLQEDLAGVQKLCGTRGYLKAKITPEPEFDDANSAVAYKLLVKQGDQYKLGEFEIEGLDEKGRARLREDWHLREGEPYDTSYPERFVRESSRDLPPGVHWKITRHEAINEEDKTVDVTITYTPGT